MVPSTNSWLSTYFSKAIFTSVYTHTLLYEHRTTQNDRNINVTKALGLKSHFWTGAQISILSQQYNLCMALTSPVAYQA